MAAAAATVACVGTTVCVCGQAGVLADAAGAALRGLSVVELRVRALVRACVRACTPGPRSLARLPTPAAQQRGWCQSRDKNRSGTRKSQRKGPPPISDTPPAHGWRCLPPGEERAVACLRRARPRARRA
eukprot:COSAG01_NODE_2310_length_7942_cov_7.405330_7_plen_129_part_00